MGHLFITLVKHMCHLRSRKLLYPAQGTSDFSFLILFHTFVIYCFVLPFFSDLILSDHVIQQIHLPLPFDIRIHFSLTHIFFQELLVEHVDSVVLLDFLLGEIWTRTAGAVDAVFFIEIKVDIVYLVESIASVIE